MSTFTTVLIIALIVAQFTPKGQAFLATDKGAAAVVGVSALAILGLIPSIVFGHSVISLAFAGIWGYMGYQRLSGARAFASRQMKRLSR